MANLPYRYHMAIEKELGAICGQKLLYQLKPSSVVLLTMSGHWYCLNAEEGEGNYNLIVAVSIMIVCHHAKSPLPEEEEE